MKTKKAERVFKVSAELVTITPAMAEQWLSLNDKNFRKLNAAYATTLAQEMAAGRWCLNGESIKFRADGSLADGQHRLYAITLAGVSVTMLVIRGVESDNGIDLGRGRQAGTYLCNDGFGNANVVAATSRFCLNFGSHWTSPDEHDVNAIRMFRVVTTRIQEFCSKRRDAMQWAADAAIKCKGLFKVPAIACVMFFGAKDNRVKGELFCELLGSGDGLASGHPIYLLRESWLKHIRNTARIGATSNATLGYAARPGFGDSVTCISYIVQSWNAFASDGGLSRFSNVAINGNPPRVPAPLCYQNGRWVGFNVAWKGEAWLK